MAHIKLFRASDNSEITEDQTNPKEFTLRADLNETQERRVYAEADTGYSVTGVDVVPTGATAARWRLAPDEAGPASGTYGAGGAGIQLGTVGAGEGGRVFFWVESGAIDSEEPSTDTSVTLEVSGIASAVS